jgi:hypothetical protein
VSDYRTSPDDTVPRTDYERVVAENVALRAELDRERSIAPELQRIVQHNVSPARVIFYATLALVVGNNIVYALGWFAVQ